MQPLVFNIALTKTYLKLKETSPRKGFEVYASEHTQETMNEQSSSLASVFITHDQLRSECFGTFTGIFFIGKNSKF